MADHGDGSMSNPTHVTLRLLGPFAIEANVGRPITIAVRSRKARALLAYLAMQRDYRGTREELATLLWGDGPDQQARHSLRQCLIALRQDLGLGSEILALDREAIWLRAQSVSVDARSFIAFAHSAEPDALTQATSLWRGAFLPDLTLDIEEFDSWQRREADRLAAAAGDVFGALCRNADAEGDGEGAIAAAERLIALEPTREDRQRITLQLFARYKGCDAALSRAKLFTDLLRSELGVAPEAATRALIDAIKRGDFEPAQVANGEQCPAASVANPVSVPDIAPVSLAASEREESSVPVLSRLSLAQAPGNTVRTSLPSWPRRVLAAASIATGIFAIGAIAALGLVPSLKLSLAMTDRQPGQVIAVLPFEANTPGQPGDPAFARALTHDLIAYLSRFGGLRVISEQTSDFFGDHKANVSHLKTDFGVQYAIVGYVQGNDDALKIDLQLVDTATQTNIWSDHLQRERTDPTVVADEASRGIARMLAIEIGHLGVLRERANPISELTPGELVARGYSELTDGHHSGKPIRGHDAFRRSFAAQSAFSARHPSRCEGAHYRGDEFRRPRCLIRSQRDRTDFKRDIGQISEFDFGALQSGAVAEVPRPLCGEPALVAPVPRAQPKLPSGAGPTRTRAHQNGTAAAGIGVNPSNHPCRNPQRSDHRLLVSFRCRGRTRAWP